MTARTPFALPWKTVMLTVIALFLAPILARASFYALGDAPRSWRDADWSSAGVLPRADADKEARLLVFTGTTGGWKGVLAVHSWIVFKPANATQWSRYDVVGWGQPVRANNWVPDGRWFGNPPNAIADLRGDEAGRLIPKVEAAIAAYRFNRPGDYRIWPGPNSNTFTATVLRAVPELGLALPPNAVGRDYRDGFYAGPTDSGTGYELNAWGLAALKAGRVEGIELSVLGLVVGLDWQNPGIKLPGYGRIGLDAGNGGALAEQRRSP